jgi:hypothetical protein
MQGRYSETGFHIGMDCNFVSLWCRHNCRSQVIDLSLSVLISWFMKSITEFLNYSNLHAIISTSCIIIFHWVKKIYFSVLEEICNNIVPHWSANLTCCNHSITRLIFFAKTAGSGQAEINSFCMWNQQGAVFLNGYGARELIPRMNSVSLCSLSPYL